jgi:Zn-dependent protease
MESSVMESNVIYQIAVWLVPLVIAIVFHEVAHGLVARRLGDPTAEQRGRLTLNPIKHIDPFGTVVLPMVLAISHAPVFGWAKPVPVNYRRLNNPRRDMVLVALAGPGMNLLLGLIGTAILAATIMLSGGADGGAAAIVAANALNFLLINIFLAVFNLLPVPPFDGGHVVEGLLPRSLARSFRKIGRYSLLVLVILLLILPAISPSANVVGRVVTPIVNTIATAFLRIFGLVA